MLQADSFYQERGGNLSEGQQVHIMHVHGQRHREIPAADGGEDRREGDMLTADPVLEGNMGK